MACNGPPNPTAPSDKIIPVTAGTNVSAVWRHTLECLSGHRETKKKIAFTYTKQLELATSWTRVIKALSWLT